MRSPLSTRILQLSRKEAKSSETRSLNLLDLDVGSASRTGNDKPESLRQPLSKMNYEIHVSANVTGCPLPRGAAR